MQHSKPYPLTNQPSMINKIFISITLFLALLMISSLANANVNVKAGTIVSSSGEVTAYVKKSDALRTLKRKSEIYSGETIKTGKSASAKIRFTDGSTINLKKNTEFEIRNYAFNDNKSKPEGKFDAFMKSGGLKAVSGLIPHDDFKLESPVAIIGIRGTSWEIIQKPDGTYTVQVYTGTVTVKLNTGKIVIMSAKNVQSRPDFIIIGKKGRTFTIPPKDRVEVHSETGAKTLKQSEVTKSEGFVNAWTGGGEAGENPQTQGNNMAKPPIFSLH